MNDSTFLEETALAKLIAEDLAKEGISSLDLDF